MTTTITGFETFDIRFPTSQGRHGSDAVHTDPDYSAAYVILRTDRPDELEGHGLTFTIGRGNELCVAAIQALAPFVMGLTLKAIRADMAGFWRSLTNESQLRWVGPEKGVIHLATAALVNAVWDLIAKVEGKPIWKLLADMTPEELVACVDFRYITDAITPEEALEIFQGNAPTLAERQAELFQDGYPSYTTSAGWLGYTDDEVRRLCREGIAAGWSHFKVKVGGRLEDDLHRCALIREEIGPDRKLMMDANQRWDVEVAIAPVGVATGEQCQNRVVFKQLMQAGAIRFCQIDACRLGGINEVLAVLLMAAKFGIPVCPHAGGVGLCEYVQHLAIFDYLYVSASLENRIVEYVDHLHEHFLDPVVIRDGRYAVPTAPGYSIAMKPASLREYAYTGLPTTLKT